MYLIARLLSYKKTVYAIVPWGAVPEVINGLIADHIASRLRFDSFKQGMKNCGLKVNDRFIKIEYEMFEEGAVSRYRN